MVVRDFICSRAEIRPHSQWNLGDFFPNLKKLPSFKKKFEDWDFHCHHTHKLHGDVLLQFNGNSMCNSYFFFY